MLCAVALSSSINSTRIRLSYPNPDPPREFSESAPTLADNLPVS
jgi:hypothetical protein